MSLPSYLKPLYCCCGDREGGQNCRCEFDCVLCKGIADARYQGEPVCLPCGEIANDRNNEGLEPLAPDPEPIPAIDLRAVFA